MEEQVQEEEGAGEGGSNKPRNEELTIEAKNFFDFYKKEVGESMRRGKNVVFIDFTKLTEFSNKLSPQN